MSAELIDEAVVCGLILCGFLAVLGVGGIIADYVLPHIPFVQRFLESLPLWDDEDD